jgi:circadian clock protein KaiC
MPSEPANAAEAAGGTAGIPLEKASTGIKGFDAISGGGLPRGRSTLVTGSAGVGKTIFGLQFLVNGITKFQEPGVLVSFEESTPSILQNAASLGLDLANLEQTGQLALESIQTYPDETEAIGSFDLEGLFLRLELAIAAVGAKRIVLDPIETLLNRFGNTDIVRSELLRLCEWLNTRQISAVMIAETGRLGELTRFGIEEYVSDCVIKLELRVDAEVSTRLLRLLKYRGSAHGTNEFPYIISGRGIELVPVTSVNLAYIANVERMSTGMPQLDEMLGGGFYRGSSILISGNTGNGKTTLLTTILTESARRGERALLVSSEESPSQLIRDMGSVAIDLKPPLETGLLRIWSERTTTQGLEERLARLEEIVDDFQPQIVGIDAIGSLGHAGSQRAVHTILVREIDLLRNRGITTLMSVLTEAENEHSSMMRISSILDTWLLLKNVEADGERTRLLVVIKSRGTSHSNQMREFRLTDQGPVLEDVVVGPAGVLTGSARKAYQQKIHARTARQLVATQQKRQALEQHVAEVEAQMALMKAQINKESDERELAISMEQDLMATQAKERLWLEQHRGEGS